jgi:hypothetical protein
MRHHPPLIGNQPRGPYPTTGQESQGSSPTRGTLLPQDWLLEYLGSALPEVIECNFDTTRCRVRVGRGGFTSIRAETSAAAERGPVTSFRLCNPARAAAAGFCLSATEHTGMSGHTGQGPGSGSRYGTVAWSSALTAVVIAAVVWLWIVIHQGKRGERPGAVLLFYLILLLASAVAGLAGVFSLFGIRSWRNALSIVPGALLGISINSFNAVLCYYAHALEGTNPGG